MISIIKKNLSFPGDSVVKNPPAKQETGVQSLGQENPLEKKMATHSSILAWEIPWTEEPGRLQSRMSQKVRQGLATEHTHTTKIKKVYLLYCSSLPIRLGVLCAQ